MAGFGSAASFIAPLQIGLQLFSHIAAKEQSYRYDADHQKMELQQLQAQQREEMRRLSEAAAQNRAEIAAKAEEEDALRRSALKRAVARQKALFGAGGTGSSGGSAQAVLLGLFDESEEERLQREKLDTMRLSAIDQSLAQARRLNVLQRTQLQQRNSLDRYASRVDTALDIARMF